MWNCASSNFDHTDCCKKNKVIKACLPYCKATEKPPTDYLKHLFCLQAFNPIRNCFKDYLESHPNLFGDE
uniref:Domain of unknown function DB domain-containing protein n=1 Tax=Panagrolaimus davidi TaxID=227884 RepID=A0A914QE54_9BILA